MYRCLTEGGPYNFVFYPIFTDTSIEIAYSLLNYHGLMFRWMAHVTQHSKKKKRELSREVRVWASETMRARSKGMREGERERVRERKGERERGKDRVDAKLWCSSLSFLVMTVFMTLFTPAIFPQQSAGEVVWPNHLTLHSSVIDWLSCSLDCLNSMTKKNEYRFDNALW